MPYGFRVYINFDYMRENYTLETVAPPYIRFIGTPIWFLKTFFDFCCCFYCLLLCLC